MKNHPIHIVLLLIALSTEAGAEAGADAGPYNWYQYRSGLGADGYDPVAYFQDKKARRGYHQHSVEYAGQRWLFRSQGNALIFRKDPERYLPAYGSHCAFGASRGYLVRGDPEAWSLRDGRLYFNYNKSVRRTWLKDPDGYIKLADRHWLKLRNPEPES